VHPAEKVSELLLTYVSRPLWRFSFQIKLIGLLWHLMCVKLNAQKFDKIKGRNLLVILQFYLTVIYLKLPVTLREL